MSCESCKRVSKTDVKNKGIFLDITLRVIKYLLSLILLFSVLPIVGAVFLFIHLILKRDVKILNLKGKTDGQ